MRFLLIRHAETVWNSEGRYQGRSDTPLSERGKLQAGLLAESLKGMPIDIIYTSPLSRAYDTARALAAGRQAGITADGRLSELDFGKWDGLTRDELKSSFGNDFLNCRREPFFYPMPGEGSLAHAKLRVDAAVQDIKSRYGASEKTVAVVTHGGILKLIIFSLLDMSCRFYRCLELDNASVTIIDVLKDRTMFRLLNDSHHLTPLEHARSLNGDLPPAGTASVLSINHIAINVSDLGKSENFYSRILGLKKSGFIDMGDHTLTYFDLTNQTRLELIHYLTHTDAASVRETSRDIYRHFCIETDNINLIYEACRKNNVSVRKKPSYIDALKCVTMLITDPNNVEIEIIQK